MRCVVLALPLLLASPALANAAGCGENASTYAEVVEARPGAQPKGPITSVPDSLCADLVEDRKPAIGSLNLQLGDPNGGANAQGSAARRRAPR